MFDSINVGPVVCTEIQYYLFSSLPSVHVILDVGPTEHAFRILQKVRSGLICVLASFHSVHPPPLLFLAGGGSGGKGWWRLSLLPNCGWGGCSFFMKNKLKSEPFNDKKLQTKMFFSAITKNLNWKILTKNSVTLRWDGAKDEKF